MATSSQPKRFPKISMTNGSERPTQTLKPGFPNTTGWEQRGIWGNDIGAYQNPQREVAGSKAPPTDNAFPNGSSAAIESNPWNTGPWNNTDPTRNTPGSTSPNRIRDSTIGELPSTPSYFPTSQPPVQPAIGQGAGRGSRINPSVAPDPSKAPYGFDAFRDFTQRNDDGEPFGPVTFETDSSIRGFRTDKRGSQDTSHSEADQHVQTTPYSAYAHGGTTAHAKRPSIPGNTAPFPPQSAIQAPFAANPIGHDEAHNPFARIPPRRAVPNGAPNGLGNGTAHGSSASQTIQLNPVSQPWDNGTRYGNGVMHSEEIFTDSMAAPYANRRGGPGDRGSPAGSAYRPGIGSPRNYDGTPPPGHESRHRPVPGDPSLVPDNDRGNQQQLLQQAAPALVQLLNQHQHYHPAYYSPHYQHPIPPHHYNPTYSTHTNLRGPMQVPSEYIQPYFIPGAVPMRPGRDVVNPTKPIRSRLLEEYRNSKSNRHYELKDIYDHIVEFSGDQAGSRFIQEKLATANSDEKDQVFREIEPNALQLMKDVFGNYVIQKFLEHGSQVQKKILAGIMEGNVVDLSLQVYACRVVQKVLEHALVEQQQILVNELKPDVLRVAKDPQGNHVIQKILQMVPRQYTGFIMDAIRGRVSELSTHNFGCRVIQRVLERGSAADKAMVMDEIYAAAKLLMTDTFGNYVIQHVIEKGTPEDRSKMTDLVMVQLVPLSKHKFASNVVEKCILCGSPELHRRVREEFTRTGDDGTTLLPSVMKDQYGNYVIQKLLGQLEGQDRASLVEEIRPQLDTLKKAGTGKQLAAIERLISAVATPAPANDNASTSRAASPAPPAEVGSPTPTPNLTMEPNSPSSSPPSTNASAVGEAVNESCKQEATPRDGVAACPEVRIDEE